MRITEHEQERRKQRMIHSAYELFCAQGIDAVPMALIAKKSGVSSNSIFRYFGTKAQLLQCTQLILWKEIVAQILSDSETRLASAQNGFEEIQILLLNFQKLYEQHSNYLVFACDFKLYLLRQKIKMTDVHYGEKLNPIYDVFIATLERGRLDGSIQKVETAQAQFFALWGVMRGYVEQIVIYDKICDGENPWIGRFPLVLHYALEALAVKP